MNRLHRWMASTTNKNQILLPSLILLATPQCRLLDLDPNLIFPALSVHIQSTHLLLPLVQQATHYHRQGTSVHLEFPEFERQQTIARELLHQPTHQLTAGHLPLPVKKMIPTLGQSALHSQRILTRWKPGLSSGDEKVAGAGRMGAPLRHLARKDMFQIPERMRKSILSEVRRVYALPMSRMVVAYWENNTIIAPCQN